ncbi:MAG: RDD family protein [Armatimonadetes bacterium]|nr:RDD family protein [Armatimonadota bacterium]
MTDQHMVLTPEKVVVSYRLASLGTRIMAHVIDVLIVAVMVWILAIGAGILLNDIPELQAIFVTLVVAFGIYLYFVLQEGLWGGQTIGKKMMSIRVLMADGTPVTFPAAIYRNLLRFGDFLPGFYLAGFLSMFTNPRSQRIGDIVSGTVVVHEPRNVYAFTPAPHRYGVHRFEENIGDLRKMTLQEYFAIKRLCDRFPELPAQTQTESLRDIWFPFAGRVGIEPIQSVHPLYQMEAVVMKYGRMHKLV